MSKSTFLINPLPEHEWMRFFEQNNYSIKNKNKIEFELHAPETVMAVMNLKPSSNKFTLELLTDYDNLLLCN